MKKLTILIALIVCSIAVLAQAEAHAPNDPNFTLKCKSGQYLKYTITSKEAPYTVIINGIKGETEGLKKLEIPAIVHYRNTDFAVTAINKDAFSDISTMVSINIPATVKNIGAGAFKNCSSLKTIKIGGIIEHCGEGAFSGTIISKPIYTGKTLVYYPANQAEFKINEGTENILEYAFSDCENMSSIIIPASVKLLYTNSFANCNKLESIVIEDGNKTFDSRNNCNAIVLTSENKIIIGCKKSTVPNGIKTIGRIAFANIGISQIELPNSITTIEDSAFYNSELASITIPESTSKIGANAFSRNKKLAVVNFNAINCEPMNDKFPAFAHCMNLTSVNFGDKVKIVPAYSFMNCEELRYVTLSNSVLEIGDKAFYECKMLSYMELPNSVEKIGTLVYYESGISEPVHSEVLFAYMPTNYATDYSIPEGIKTIAQRSFHYAGNLNSVTIPNSVTKIEKLAFAECIELEKVVMSNNIETIESKSFWECPKLKSITLPKSLTNISNDALKECQNLKYIYIPQGTTAQFKKLLEPEFHSKLREK